MVSICPVIRLNDSAYETIAAESVRFLKEISAGTEQSFKVFTRRIDKSYPGTSEEISASLGGVILEACPNLHVDVRNPELKFNVEIRNEGVLLYALSIPGPGRPIPRSAQSRRLWIWHAFWRAMRGRCAFTL